MALRTLNLLLSGLLLTALVSTPVHACFGPKLFFGAGSGVQEEALYALITLYVQEKTGIESVRVDVEPEQEPLLLLSGNKADLVFVRSDLHADAVFQMAGLPLLVTGKRPLEELQFTTVLPAVRKLNRLLKKADVELLVSRIESGESPLSVARNFLMELRWI